MCLRHTTLVTFPSFRPSCLGVRGECAIERMFFVVLYTSQNYLNSLSSTIELVAIEGFSLEKLFVWMRKKRYRTVEDYAWKQQHHCLWCLSQRQSHLKYSEKSPIVLSFEWNRFFVRGSFDCCKRFQHNQHSMEISNVISNDEKIKSVYHFVRFILLWMLLITMVAILSIFWIQPTLLRSVDIWVIVKEIKWQYFETEIGCNRKLKNWMKKLLLYIKRAFKINAPLWKRFSLRSCLLVQDVSNRTTSASIDWLQKRSSNALSLLIHVLKK